MTDSAVTTRATVRVRRDEDRDRFWLDCFMGEGRSVCLSLSRRQVERLCDDRIEIADLELVEDD